MSDVIMLLFLTNLSCFYNQPSKSGRLSQEDKEKCLENFPRKSSKQHPSKRVDQEPVVLVAERTSSFFFQWWLLCNSREEMCVISVVLKVRFPFVVYVGV